MPLPAPNSPWPPRELVPALDQFAVWDAWWSGDPEQLAAVYGGSYAGRTGGRVNRPSQSAGGVVGALARMWWGRPSPANEPEAKLHVPMGGDLARTAADLLFAEPVKVLAPQDEQVNARLEELLDDTGHSRLIEAAELVAALGGGYVRPVFDVELSDRAWLDCVAPDAAVPTWRWGRLVDVVFWREVDADDEVVYRHLEEHTRGWIRHALFRGTRDDLGRAVPLQDMPDTEHLAELVNSDLAIETGYPGLDVTYVPHMLPNRAWRRRPMLAPMGRSVMAGCEAMMDALDQTYSEFMTDVDLAAGKVIIPESWLDDQGPGRGARYDPNRRYFATMPGALKMDTPTVVQHDIRVEKFEAAVELHIRQILRHAGFSPGSAGELRDGGGLKTATEVTADERRSMLTRGRQIGYWRPGLLGNILPALLHVDAYAFGRGDVGDVELAVEFADSVQEDMLTLANTVKALADATSASIATRVRILHPEWDEDQVDEEVVLIREDSAAAMPAPFDYGTGPGDPGETADQRAAAGDAPPDGPPDVGGSGAGDA